MKKKILLIYLATFLGNTLTAQTITGILTGKVIDIQSEIPIPLATITIINTHPVIGTTTDKNGKFELANIPVGRHVVHVSFIGYETMILNDILVLSRNNPTLKVPLKERLTSLDEVVILPRQKKEKPLNKMAVVSTKQLNMEEANRFAGGFDDPARLASSFAGVASNIGNNQLVVRGNSPKGILWQIEGVAIPNPNHFGEITGFGGGGITALSSKIIGNSDFFTGAFPAEYGNALSSVFDLSIRNGSTSERQHSFQASFFGLDVASEGPLKKGGSASYLMNYRYATLGLFDLGIKYQDLSFKVNIPTKKAGTFSIWGLGFIDETNSKPDTDTLYVDDKWKYYDDISTENAKLITGIGGVTHKIFINDKSYLKTSMTAALSKISSNNSRLDATLRNHHPLDKIKYNSLDFRLNTLINTKFNSNHTNKTGIKISNLNYDFKLENSDTFGQALSLYAKDKGNGTLVQGYSQSTFSFGNFQVNPGIHFLHFSTNNKQSIEPRLGLNYQLNSRNKFSFGYGLHSQIEKISFYLANIPTSNGNQQLNKDMNFTKSHHFVLAYDSMFGNHTHLRIEPYYQYLYNVPVVNNTYFSMLTLVDDFFINDELKNTGTGKNIGIDFTLERFLHNGLYYLATLSVFDSKYTDGNGLEQNTPFNRNYIANFLIGREWLLKEKNLFSANLKYTFLGGNRMHPIDKSLSLASREIIEDFSAPYSVKNPNSHVVSLTFSYRINRKKSTRLWSLQIINALAAKEQLGYQYNFNEHRLDRNTDEIILPNLSYKIEF